jgi:hypothetical protein
MAFQLNVMLHNWAGHSEGWEIIVFDGKNGLKCIDVGYVSPSVGFLGM